MPAQYSITMQIKQLLKNSYNDCIILDFRPTLNKWQIRINTQMFRFPDKLRKKWEHFYFKKINQWYIKQFRIHKPNLVFIYNNEMLLPATLKWLKEKKMKIVFFLGDNPLYTPTSRYNLTVLEYADAVFVPDTFWQHQLLKIGIPNVFYLLLPLPEEQYFPVKNLSESEKKQLQTDILYVGMSYNDSWGYKKAKFLSFFVNNKLQIHGNQAWKRWFQFFPELEPYFINKQAFIPVEKLNKMYNCTKIIPVDGNPGIFNGIHLRILEALSAGALPLMEFNADMDFIFKDVSDLPAVKDYRAIPEMVEYYLSNENSRCEMIDKMTHTYKNQFSNKLIADYLINKIDIK